MNIIPLALGLGVVAVIAEVFRMRRYPTEATDGVPFRLALAFLGALLGVALAVLVIQIAIP